MMRRCRALFDFPAPPIDPLHKVHKNKKVGFGQGCDVVVVVVCFPNVNSRFVNVIVIAKGRGKLFERKILVALQKRR